MDMLRFGYESSTAVVILFEDGRATLSSVHSEVRREGHATILLEIITEWADENKKNLALSATPCGEEPGPDALQLKAFYERFGFKALDEDRDYYIPMMREFQ